MGKLKGPSRSSFDRILIRRLEACKSSNVDNKFRIDEIVANLQSNYRDYERLKQVPFRKRVEKALDFHRRRNISNAVEDEDEEDDAHASNNLLITSPARKKLKKMDEREERLLRTETDHLRRRQREQSTDDEDGAVSTSDDAIYESTVEPEFDLMKSILRANYTKNPVTPSKVGEGESSTKVGGGQGDAEKNMEVEDCDKEKKIERVRGNGGIEKGKLVKGRDECEEKDGPMFKDLGGMEKILDELRMEVIFPLYHPQLPRSLGVKPMSGILLHGPPGCGKTKLAHAIANETGFPFYKISATEVVTGVSGASEGNIRDLFEKAYRTAPSIVFIDEIDAIASKRENLQREMERRIVTQLLTSMDELHQTKGSADVETDSGASDQSPGYVLVIGATNRPDAVDAALRRPGRFDREFILGVPDEKARAEILYVLTQSLRLEGNFDLNKIAMLTPGFVGADLAAVANKAGNLAMKRIIDKRKSELSVGPENEGNSEEWWRRPWIPEEMDSLSITMSDFEEAAKIVQPSTRREGFSTIPNVKWEDVGGLDLLRKEFDRYIVRRIKHPKDYEEFGVDMETGFLLYGPPGCGKTLIAKAVANEAGANFIHIKGPELLNKYVGESELAVRTIFSRARVASPCILFFDEVDAITRKRGEEGGGVERLFTQLLIELDGADKRQGVYVIGATNRPEDMDDAVKRPGRFGKLLYVPLPGPDERGLILKALARKKPINEDVDLMAIGRKEACENLSGADLAAMFNEAAMVALEEKLVLGHNSSDTLKTWTIKETHFERALEKISPSVSIKQRSHYKNLSQRLGSLQCLSAA